MRHFLLSFAASTLLASSAFADADRAERLIGATRLADVISVMRQEGLQHAEAIEQGSFPGQGGLAWRAEAERIHDVGRAMEDMRTSLSESLADDQIEPVIAFFETELGAKIISAEISAREAMLADEVDEMAEDALAEMRARDDNRLDAIARFIQANDLIEANVVGGLNSNFAFFRGLADGGAYETEMTDSQMLAEVWSQEEELRQGSEDWLFSYLSLAYSALADDELEAYIEISETKAGSVFNRAIFAAFDVLFTRTSYELGLAAGRFMNAEDA